MNIVLPTNTNELAYCTDMYIDYTENKISVNRDYCIKNISNHWQQGKYIRVLKDMSRIRGFIMADIQRSHHCIIPYYQQEYFCSDYIGFKAAKAIMLSHGDLLLQAKKENVRKVISQGSPLDEENIFAKILEKAGWERLGYMAIYKL